MSNQDFKRSSEENTKALKLSKYDEMFSLPTWLLRRMWQVKQIDLSSSDFEKILHSAGFVDKTPLIREFIFPSSRSISTYALVVTTPRKFGKSTNADMLRRFLGIEVDENGNRIPNDRSDNYRLFTSPIPGTNPPCKLKISQDEEIMEKYFGTHPVIYLKFRGDTINSVDDAKAACKMAIHEAFKDHRYLIKSPKLRDLGRWKICEQWCSETEYMSLDEWRMGDLRYLSEYLFRHHGKRCFVICDDYDIMLTSCIFRVGNSVLEEIARESMSCLHSLCNENRSVEKCFFTGTIHYFAVLDWCHAFLDRVILSHDRFLESENVWKFFGLTLDELQMLKTRFFLDDSEFDDLVEYYNGYYGLKRVNVLNPYSVMSYLKYRQFDHYWCKLGALQNLSDALKSLTVKRAVLRAIGGIDDTTYISRSRPYTCHTTEYIEKIMENPKKHWGEQLLDFMLQLGYFTRSKDVEVEDWESINITIPNNEIRLNFIEKLKENYQAEQSVDLELVEECTKYWNSLDFSDASVVKEKLKEICRILNDIFLKVRLDKLDGASCHEILLVTLLDNKFTCKSEGLCEYSSPKLDFLLEFKDCRVIIELKYGEDSLSALKGIIDRKYCDDFEENNVRVNHYVLLGINVSERKVITMHALLDKKDLIVDDLMDF